MTISVFHNRRHDQVVGAKDIRGRDIRWVADIDTEDPAEALAVTRDYPDWLGHELIISVGRDIERGTLPGDLVMSGATGQAWLIRSEGLQEVTLFYSGRAV